MQVTTIGSIARISLIHNDNTFTYSIRDTSYSENSQDGFYSFASGLNGHWEFTVIDFGTYFRAIGLFFNETNHYNDASKSLNDGKKWEVDAIMRKNMLAIHEKLEKTTELIKTNSIKKDDYSELSDVISTSTQSIATNCKMEPKADSTFHVILKDLFSLSESLKESNKTKDSIKQLTNALKKYSKYFNQNF